MDIEISHLTRFDYDEAVRPQLHLIYLRPRDNPLLEVVHSRFQFMPEAKVHWMRDDLDNLPATLEFLSDAARVEIHSECLVRTSDSRPFDFLVRDYARSFPFIYEPLHGFNLGPYLANGELENHVQLREWIMNLMSAPPSSSVGWLLDLNLRISRAIRYRRRTEQGIQDPLETIQAGSGSCRDYAVLMVECVRAVGLAARFVSGYKLDLGADGIGGGDMHAWAEVYLPGAGWRGIDPSCGIFCDNTYVPVAHAAIAESVNPVQGSYFSVAPTTARMTTEIRVQQCA